MIIEINSFLGDTNPDYKEALEIRNQVFVIEQHVDHFLEYDAYDLESIHFILKMDGEPCATARYRNTNLGIKLERFAVLKKARGYGFGYLLLKIMLKDIRYSKSEIYLHAQTGLTSFYGAAGFVPVGEVFSEASINHVKMILKK